MCLDLFVHCYSPLEWASQQNCNSQHLSSGFALTTTFGCRSGGVDWIMICTLQDREHDHRNSCTSRFGVCDRRCRGQDLRMAPGRSIWPIHRSTFGSKWVTGLAETGGAPVHAAPFGLHVPRLPNTRLFPFGSASNSCP